MALYLGSGEKVLISTSSGVYCLNIYSSQPIVNGSLLMSLDNYILKDSNGLYLTVKEND